MKFKDHWLHKAGNSNCRRLKIYNYGNDCFPI